MCTVMNAGMTNPPPVVCDSAIEVSLESPAHAGDIHVHPVHPLPVAPVDVFERHTKVDEVQQVVTLTQTSPVVQEQQATRQEIELVAVVADISVPVEAIVKNETQQAIVVEKSPLIEVRIDDVKVDVKVDVNKSESVDVALPVITVAPTVLDVSEKKEPVEEAVVVPDAQVVTKPVKPRATRASKTTTQASTMPVEQTTSVVPTEEKTATVEEDVDARKNLSKRPRRGIRIKGQE